MFGLDTISWIKFIVTLFLLCSIYYAAVFIRAWFSLKSRVSLFENPDGTEVLQEQLLPVSVSASAYPEELIPFNHIEPVALQVDFYADNGIDEGYNIEYFAETNNQKLPKILEQVQFYQ